MNYLSGEVSKEVWDAFRIEAAKPHSPEFTDIGCIDCGMPTMAHPESVILQEIVRLLNFKDECYARHVA